MQSSKFLSNIISHQCAMKNKCIGSKYQQSFESYKKIHAFGFLLLLVSGQLKVRFNVLEDKVSNCSLL